jgi:hypothetical protein
VKRDVTKRDVTKREVTKREVTKREVTKREVTKRDVTKREVTKREVTKREVTKREVKEFTRWGLFYYPQRGHPVDIALNTDDLLDLPRWELPEAPPQKGGNSQLSHG